MLNLIPPMPFIIFIKKILRQCQWYWLSPLKTNSCTTKTYVLFIYAMTTHPYGQRWSHLMEFNLIAEEQKLLLIKESYLYYI